LTLFQCGVWYCGIEIYNHLPPTHKELSDDIIKFKVTLKNFFWKIHFTHWRDIIAGNKVLGS
jgi:hypothetical protein